MPFLFSLAYSLVSHLSQRRDVHPFLLQFSYAFAPLSSFIWFLSYIGAPRHLPSDCARDPSQSAGVGGQSHREWGAGSHGRRHGTQRKGGVLEVEEFTCIFL
jgi:hypothetical protein